jgi:hypothetical protein
MVVAPYVVRCTRLVGRRVTEKTRLSTKLQILLIDCAVDSKRADLRMIVDGSVFIAAITPPLAPYSTGDMGFPGAMFNSLYFSSIASEAVRSLSIKSIVPLCIRSAFLTCKLRCSDKTDSIYRNSSLNARTCSDVWFMLPPFLLQRLWSPNGWYELLPEAGAGDERTL